MRPETVLSVENPSTDDRLNSAEKSCYSVKEIFYTLQGEGLHAGRAAVFCRFSGCNLWNGKETGRQSAVCQFCDTDFVGVDGDNGGKYPATDLATKVASVWQEGCGDAVSQPYVVCTGGEPLLQLNDQLIDEFHKAGFEIAIETNGTIEVPNGVDWVTVSPKANAELVVTEGDELKLVYPQVENAPSDFETFGFDNFFVQPMDGPNAKENTLLATQFCLSNPKWRLSLQTHKLLGLQ